MENTKGKIILIIVLVIILFTSLGYYVSFNAINDENKEESNKDSDITIEDNSISVNNGNLKSDDKVNKEETEEYEEVVLTSKIGTKVLSNFYIANIYSSFLYDEIDQVGLTDKAKLMFTYITINSNYDYHNMIKSSEEIGEYIEVEDFEKVYKTLFGSNSKITHDSIINENIYDSENKCYKCLTFGFGEGDFKFALEIPFEIREYKDRVEASFYRIYATANSSIDEEGVQTQVIDLYADSTRSKKIYSGSDERLQFNDGQEEYINKLIADGEIKKDDLKVVTYILKEKNGNYYIEDIKN